MKTDRTTKALLFAIALGLWIQIAGAVFRPVPVQAQGTLRISGDPQLSTIVMTLQSINSDTGAMKSSLRSIQLAEALR